MIINLTSLNRVALYATIESVSKLKKRNQFPTKKRISFISKKNKKEQMIGKVTDRLMCDGWIYVLGRLIYPGKKDKCESLLYLMIFFTLQASRELIDLSL